jgi:hypothetical protein
VDEERGGLHAVYTNEPERLLRELFAEGASVRDLTVTDADLEDAFVALTKGEALTTGEALTKGEAFTDGARFPAATQEVDA